MQGVQLRLGFNTIEARQIETGPGRLGLRIPCPGGATHKRFLHDEIQISDRHH